MQHETTLILARTSALPTFSFPTDSAGLAICAKIPSNEPRSILIPDYHDDEHRKDAIPVLAWALRTAVTKNPPPVQSAEKATSRSRYTVRQYVLLMKKTMRMNTGSCFCLSSPYCCCCKEATTCLVG
ncbi:hypothetical protein BJ508DRAFT_307123 [Ascobolus immersus RN42]|uniref:Uncharacterized protein n=1 Tax=Ascobolus immersus RN42 TaxID=1160509 RepID=A0A3N4I5E1_ASCIM|nr:hypothetical protein BJ508DRAFT_307123 [Ascobolus immersus RN42]